MASRKLTRRDFVKVGATGTAALLLGRNSASGGGLASAMPTRPFGETGHDVKLFSLGGQATLERSSNDPTEATRLHDESIAIINRAIDLGVNYIDTAAAYGRGISQERIGEVMAARRDEVFLATKTHNRSRDGSLRLLEESLRLLQTDHLDLWQLHNISREEQLDTIFGTNGAIEALQEAREEKIVRFLGITGHYNPNVLIKGINEYGFDFDTILMALNPADKNFLPFQQQLLPMAKQKRMGVIAMKIPARGRLFQDGGVTSMKDAMSYVLTLDGVCTVIVGCDNVAQLEENVSIATDWQPLSSGEMARLEGLTESYAAEAAFFKEGGAGFGRRGTDDQGFLEK
jgi:aryl-alcohol dehydrogenase-like predicted oxidoreductase